MIDISSRSPEETDIIIRRYEPAYLTSGWSSLYERMASLNSSRSDTWLNKARDLKIDCFISIANPQTQGA